MYQTIVIGGGPSGLMAAISASAQGGRVLLIDKKTSSAVSCRYQAVVVVTSPTACLMRKLSNTFRETVSFYIAPLILLIMKALSLTSKREASS